MLLSKLDSAVRGVIAIVVILVTWLLTSRNLAIAEQWQAVFLMVIAYYFKERPQTDRLGPAIFDDWKAYRLASIELTSQFGIALVLLGATTWLFAAPHNRQFLATIAGAWVGGVTLAIAFYFKDVTPTATTQRHNLYRSVIAVGVGLATLIIFMARVGTSGVDPLPLQWVTLAFVVIAFYFKEKGEVLEAPSQAEPQPPPRPSADDALGGGTQGAVEGAA